MKECLLRADFHGFVESMRLGWTNKKRSAASVSNPHIDEVYEAAVKAGALAGKVSGAGGGGFMLFFVPTERRMDVIRTLEKFNGQVSNCHFTKSGAEAWRI
jgi:D-glycero-alpha-D-manno-heptose-7-phosphate kinase